MFTVFYTSDGSSFVYPVTVPAHVRVAQPIVMTVTGGDPPSTFGGAVYSPSNPLNIRAVATRRAFLAGGIVAGTDLERLASFLNQPLGPRCGPQSFRFNYQISGSLVDAPQETVVFDEGELALAYPENSFPDCDGTGLPDPELPPVGPNNDDNPYGPLTPSIPLVGPPPAPDDPCLTPAFVQPTPTISTPCSSAAGNTAVGTFTKLS